MCTKVVDESLRRLRDSGPNLSGQLGVKFTIKKMKSHRKRKRLKRLYEYYISLHTVLGAVTFERQKHYESTLRAILHEIPDSALDVFQKQLVSQIEADKKTYGVIASDETIREIASTIQRAPAGKSLLMPKSLIMEMFEKYSAIKPEIDKLPTYARIGLRYGAKEFPDAPNYFVEVYLPEAQIFEDIAILFNSIPDDDGTLKIVEKTKGAVVRAITVNCFNLLEAYINGLALDFVSTTDRELTEAEKDLLTETRKGALKYVGLRKKLLQYPRIIGDRKHPIIQESNSKAFRYLMSEVQPYRNSIVHQSQLGDMEGVGKGELFLTFNAENASRIIDATIEVIRQIETGLFGDNERIWWLSDRGHDGQFPPNTFH